MIFLDTYQELAYGANEGQLSCLLEARGTPEVQLKRNRQIDGMAEQTIHIG